MVYTDQTWFCDACGKKIENYRGRLVINRNLNDAFTDIDDAIESEGMDLCKDCMKSFEEWKESRMS